MQVITDGLQPVDIWNRWLEHYVTKLQDVGGGMVKGQCPFHQDRTPSFSASRDEFWFKCFGCDAKGNAIQFGKMKNLDIAPFRGFDFSSGTYHTPIKKRSNTDKSHSDQRSVETDKPSENKTPKNGNKCRKKEAIDRLDLVPHNGEKVPPGWNMEGIKALKVAYSKKRECIAFPILDSDGKWLECYCHKPVSKFLGGGKFKCSLYPLHLIKTYDPEVETFVVEGMKDACTMLSQGLQVVTSTNGALTIPNDLTPIKHLKKFVHLPDYDESGYDGQRKWAEALKKACSQAKVYLSDWEELPGSFTKGTDISEVTSVTLVDLINTQTLYKRGFQTMSLGDFVNTKMKEYKYLIENVLVQKGITLVASTDGVGKSLLASQLGLSLTTGSPFMGYFPILKTAPVMLIQFELEDEELQRRVKRQLEGFGNVTTSQPYYFGKRDKSKIFENKWDYIELTLDDHSFYEGVVIIDNLYTSTELNISNNDECRRLLQKIDFIKMKYDTAFVLLGHFTKTEPGTPLRKEDVEGGKSLTNYVNNTLLLGRSTLNPEMRIGKLMKVRKGKSSLEGIPFKMYLDDNLNFKKGGIIEKENAHFQVSTSKTEIVVLKRFKNNCTPHKDYPDNDIITIDDYYQEMVNHLGYEPTKRTAFNWISKLMDWGLVKKVAHSLYEIVWSEMDDV